MPFNSLPYLVFLAVAVAAYWLLPARFRRVFVLVTSLAFYATCVLVRHNAAHNVDGTVKPNMVANPRGTRAPIK